MQGVSFKKFYMTVAIAALLGLSATACTPVGVAAGVGATVGLAAAQEGGIKTATTDTAIRVSITDMWLKHDVNMYRRLSMTVTEGRVLITGAVPNPDMRVDAVRLAWQADGVRQVINEVTIDEGGGVTGYVSDGFITTNLKTQMMFDKYVQSINYSIETVKGTVYLMGIAQDQKELDRVLDRARNTKYVKNVVSYVRLRGEQPPGALNPETGELESRVN